MHCSERLRQGVRSSQYVDNENRKVRELALAEGRAEGVLETAKKMLSLGEAEDKVALFTGLPISQIKTLL